LKSTLKWVRKAMRSPVAPKRLTCRQICLLSPGAAVVAAAQAVAQAVAQAAVAAVEWAALEWAVVVAEVSPAVMVVTVVTAVKGQVAIMDKVPCKDKVPWANQLRNTSINPSTNIKTETIMVSTPRLNRIMAPVTAPATMVKALKTVPAMVRIRPDNC
jgi:hypothetical protein